MWLKYILHQIQECLKKKKSLRQNGYQFFVSQENFACFESICVYFKTTRYVDESWYYKQIYCMRLVMIVLHVGPWLNHLPIIMADYYILSQSTLWFLRPDLEIIGSMYHTLFNIYITNSQRIVWNTSVKYFLKWKKKWITERKIQTNYILIYAICAFVRQNRICLWENTCSNF